MACFLLSICHQLSSFQVSHSQIYCKIESGPKLSPYLQVPETRKMIWGDSVNNSLIVENKHKEERASERVKINGFGKRKQLGRNEFRSLNTIPLLGRKERG